MTKNKFQVGVHETGSGLKDVSPVENWELRWEAEKMPKMLSRIGMEMELIPDFLHQALGLAEKYEYVTLKLLHSAKDVDLALSRPKDELARTLHVSSSPKLLKALLPHLVEEPWPPFPANCSVPPSIDPGFLLHILWTLTLNKIPVLTLPLVSTTPSSMEQMQWSAQSEPGVSLGHAYFPATLKTFQLIHSE